MLLKQNRRQQFKEHDTHFSIDTWTKFLTKNAEKKSTNTSEMFSIFVIVSYAERQQAISINSLVGEAKKEDNVN